MAQATQGERIAVLEAVHRESNQLIMDRLDKLERHMAERFDKMEAKQTGLSEKLKEYENKGKGFLIAVGLFGTALGATVIAGVDKLLEFFR